MKAVSTLVKEKLQHFDFLFSTGLRAGKQRVVLAQLRFGAFANADDAEKLKAKLSLQGMDVAVQSVTIPDKGVMNRVRTGPYQGTDEMNKARAALKLTGTDSTPIRVP